MLRTALCLLLLSPLGASPEKVMGEGPLDFRCDNMQVETKPNRSVCRDNVVVRRGNLLVCCKTFEGFADDKWLWQRFVCKDEVRAQRGDELMWSQKAEFILDTSTLILTGRPHVQRGQSMFEGKRIVVDVKSDKAQIDSPRGVFVSTDKLGAPVDETPDTSPLPSVCPIAKDPMR